MYRTCLYCTHDLGANAMLETLPVGRRIAFDSGTGRLWVVCRGCAKWNLVPFDTRLETIDACERLFRGTRTRYSTDNIGIARLPEGLDLVRVGRAERPEFAAWRYGDQFGRRRVRAGLGWAAGITVGAVVIVGRHALLPVGVSVGVAQQIVTQGLALYSRHRVVLRHPAGEKEGTGGVMTAFDARKTAVWRTDDNSWCAAVPLRRMVAGPMVLPTNRPVLTHLDGADAGAALGRILPRINGNGGSRRAIGNAVELVETGKSLDGVVRHALRDDAVGPDGEVLLKNLKSPERLALEMSAHEQTERAALEGELKLLERQWQQADALARVADSLALPESPDPGGDR